MSKFLGFEKPSNSPDAAMWIDRIHALQHDYPNEWAKYGPYNSQNSAYHAKSKIDSYKNKLTRQKCRLEVHVTHDEHELWYVYVIVRNGEVSDTNRH